jgi:hypothetical protein
MRGGRRGATDCSVSIRMLAGATTPRVVSPVYAQYLLSPKAEPFFAKQGFIVY